jgi:peptidoglycan/LPS O-acetylase OafA/YrhL
MGLVGQTLVNSPQAVVNLSRTGYVAVSGFFVLSGFILAYNYGKDPRWPWRRLINFAVARFARIYPVYCIGLLLTVPFFVLWVIRGISMFGVWQIRSLLLNLGLLQAWDPRIALSWNSPGWSLSAELFFYLCFPLLMTSFSGVRRSLSVVGALVLVWIVSLSVPVLFTFDGSGYGPASAYGEASLGAPVVDEMTMNFVKFNPLVRLGEFCMGLLVCRIYWLLRGKWSQRGYWFYVPAVAGLVGVLAFAQRLPYLPTHNVLLAPLFASMILGLALEGGFLAALLSRPPVVFLREGELFSLHPPCSYP